MKNTLLSISNVLFNQVHLELLMYDDRSKSKPELLTNEFKLLTELQKTNKFFSFVLIPSSSVGSKGAGFVKNRCLEKASGDYIIQLDSDDYWSESYLQLLLLKELDLFEKTKKHQPVFGNLTYVTERGILVRSFSKDLTKSTVSTKDFMHFQGSLHPLLHTNIVPTEGFDEGYLASDVIWSAKALDVSNKLYGIESCEFQAQAHYYCVLHNSSVCSTSSQDRFNTSYAKTIENYSKSENTCIPAIFKEKVAFGVKYNKALELIPSLGFHEFWLLSKNNKNELIE